MNKQAEVVGILTTIQDTEYKDVANPTQLMEYGFQLAGWIAFTGEAVAEAKELLHNARKQAYLNLVASLGSQGKKIGEQMKKDYCNDCCAKEQAYLSLCERANAAATHACDLVRSALSYLKTEMATSSYAN